MKAIYLAVMGLSFLGIFTVHSAPVNITGNKTGFMEVMYSNLTKRNLSHWIFPPKEDSVNKSAIFQQVDTSCQTHATNPNLTEDSMAPIYYVCASMLETINNIWGYPHVEKLIEDNKDKVELPSKLDDLYKEEDLRNLSEFCQHFSKLLSKEDFNTDLSKFLDNFSLNFTTKNPSSCETVCKNSENKSIIYMGEVNPVCAIWRKGYYIYKMVSSKNNEGQAKNLSSKPINSQNDKKDRYTEEVEDHTKDVGHQGDTDTKKKMQLVAFDTEPVLEGAATSKGKQPSLIKTTVLGMTKTIDKNENPQQKLLTNDEKSLKSVNEKKDEKSVSESEDKNQNGKGEEETLRPVKENSLSKAVISSSTQSSDVAPDDPDPPMPPVSKDQLSSPKPFENSKDNKSPLVPNANKQPPSKSPSGVGGASSKLEQQNQNEAPPEADYDDGDGMPPPSLSDKGRIYDATDDDNILETVDQNRKKPKSQSSSVSVSKETHGDNIEFDKVSIQGDSATVNVEFNEQSDPGVINYFVCFLGLLAILYLLFHNKKRLIAYVVEGRKPQTGRRRSSSTQYRKLENNYD